jgi:hypothetical protein
LEALGQGARAEQRSEGEFCNWKLARQVAIEERAALAQRSDMQLEAGRIEPFGCADRVQFSASEVEAVDGEGDANPAAQRGFSRCTT